MAKRPRQHILETESKKAFSFVIPSDWVINTPQFDYGIDEIVQIFEKQQITPYSFSVQLKATDDLSNKQLLTLFQLND